MTEIIDIATPPTKKDPNGLMRADMRYLRNIIKPLTIEPGVTESEVMYSAGQQHVLDFIERTMVAGRS